MMAGFHLSIMWLQDMIQESAKLCQSQTVCCESFMGKWESNVIKNNKHILFKKHSQNLADQTITLEQVPTFFAIQSAVDGCTQEHKMFPNPWLKIVSDKCITYSCLNKVWQTD